MKHTPLDIKNPSILLETSQKTFKLEVSFSH